MTTFESGKLGRSFAIALENRGARSRTIKFSWYGTAWAVALFDVRQFGACLLYAVTYFGRANALVEHFSPETNVPVVE